MRTETEILGIDIGNVIIGGRGENDTSFFSDNFLATPAVEGAFDAIATLVQRFGSRVYLVSKCGKRTQERSLLWLQHHNFWERTGITPDRVHFCLGRADKAPICESLGVSHFIDDRLEVLSYLTTVPNRYLFQSNPNEVSRFKQHLKGVVKVSSWAELLKKLTV